MHTRTVGIKDAHDFNIEIVLTVVIKKEGFSTALTFVIARANANRVYLAPIALWLRVHFWVAIYFARRSLQNTSPSSFGKAKHINSTMHTSLGSLHRIVLVVDWRCWASQVIDLIGFYIQRECHIMTHEL